MNAAFTVAELDRQLGILGVAGVSAGNSGLARVRIMGAFGEGEMYQHGAHVTSWKPAAKDEVLFVSTKSRWEEGQAIRGGMPICFPLVPRQVGLPARSCAWIRAYNNVADRVHP